MSALYKEFQDAMPLPTPFERLNWLKFVADLVKQMGLILFYILVYLLGLLSHSDQGKFLAYEEFLEDNSIFTVRLKKYGF